VLKDRTLINKSNASKLAKLTKDIAHTESTLRNSQSAAAEIKGLELELGELNQQLLLINEDLSELNFKLMRKRQTISQLRTRNQSSAMQVSTLTNQTPTFPSKELYSEQPKLPSEDPPNPTEALKNIEQLINRYERIKSKDEHKH
jgi:septal ring factor EnvC (AmiA/AmiB activator)